MKKKILITTIIMISILVLGVVPVEADSSGGTTEEEYDDGYDYRKPPKIPKEYDNADIFFLRGHFNQDEYAWDVDEILDECEDSGDAVVTLLDACDEGQSTFGAMFDKNDILQQNYLDECSGEYYRYVEYTHNIKKKRYYYCFVYFRKMGLDDDGDENQIRIETDQNIIIAQTIKKYIIEDEEDGDDGDDAALIMFKFRFDKNTEEILAMNLNYRPYLNVEIRGDGNDDSCKIRLIFDGEIVKTDREFMNEMNEERREELLQQKEVLVGQLEEKQQQLEEKRGELATANQEWEAIKGNYERARNWTFSQLKTNVNNNQNAIGAVYIYIWFKENLNNIYDKATTFVDLPNGISMNDITSYNQNGKSGFEILDVPEYYTATVRLTPVELQKAIGIYGNPNEFNEAVSLWATTAKNWLTQSGNQRLVNEAYRSWLASNSDGEQRFLEAWKNWSSRTITNPKFLEELRQSVVKRNTQELHVQPPSNIQQLESEINELEGLIDGINRQIEFINEQLNIVEQAINQYLFDQGAPRGEVPFTSVLMDWMWYANKANEYNDNENPISFTQKVSVIITLITNIGMVVSVLMSAFMGIKYMLGSVEEKAEFKKDLIPYLVGAILLFGISAIVKVMLEIGKSINNS